MNEFLAIIPARGQSKGIPRKNVQIVAGKPLIAWSIEHALQTSRVGRVIVSTDDAEIADVARKYGADVPFVRPAELATDTSATEPVLIHAVQYLSTQEGYHSDAVILLQPTSPVRSKGALDKAITQFLVEDADCLVSTHEIHPFLWRDPASPEPLYDISRRPRRQDIAPEKRVYEENGSIYITRTELLLSEKSRLVSGKISMFVMNKEESIDIDTPTDIAITDYLLKRDNSQ